MTIPFNSTPPTEPGAYWWRRNSSESPSPVEVWLSPKNRLISWAGYDNSISVEQRGGEWSPRLVPVTEIEKAYKEGFDAAAFSDGKHGINNHYIDSRAKQIVEGTKQ